MAIVCGPNSCTCTELEGFLVGYSRLLFALVAAPLPSHWLPLTLEPPASPLFSEISCRDAGSQARVLAGGVLRRREEDVLQRRVFPGLHRRFVCGRRRAHLRVLRGRFVPLRLNSYFTRGDRIARG